jgi:hypothetical protein
VVAAVLLVVVGPVVGNRNVLAATAVDKLLMMGMRMPETCQAVFKGQAIKLRD